MMIRSKDVSYEVIQILLEEEGVVHYRCRNAGESESGSWLLVCLSRERLGAKEISYILEIEDNPGFTGLKEYFWLEESMILVFPYPDGKPLMDWLEESGELMKDRFQAGKNILEYFLIFMMPQWLIWEVSRPEFLYLSEKGTVKFYYSISHFEDYETVDGAAFWKRLAEIFRILFQKEEWEGLYPEVQELLEVMESGIWPGILEGYQAYLELLPVCMQERTIEKQEKEPFFIRVQKLAVKLLTVGKIVMGVGVLLAALVMIPNVWKEQVQPYIEAAALWKAVYVDGETQEAETDVPEESEEELCLDNGFVTHYWENERICYQGDMVNGLYEGKGTLYYSSGTIQYQGEFEFGRKEGQGSLYTEEGTLLYEGGFHKDKYEGEGKLYEKNFGSLVYEGGFSAGKYDGQGILFNPMTDYPVYKGTFRLGYYDGNGVEYDSNGILLYEGEFLLGVYHGTGIYYDVRTGQAMLEGQFRNGMLVAEVLETEEPEAKELEAETPEMNVQPGPEGEGENEGIEDSMETVENG